MGHEPRAGRGGVLVAIAALAMAACSLDVSYERSRYACQADENCPGGFRCGAAGYCEEATEVPPADAQVADVALLDDGAVAPDAELIDGAVSADAEGPADAAPPDASPPPDAHPDAAPPPPDASTGPVTVTLVAARDTGLNSNDRSFNYGGTVDLVCNGNPDAPVLFAWDLSGIPTGAVVDSVTLRLSTAGNALQGESASVFALSEAWSEGNANGANGVANYDLRTGNIAWSTAGAKPPSRGSTAIATFAPTTTNTTFDVALPRVLVQSWVSVPAANNGLIVTCPLSNDVAFHSRAVAGKEPRLVVTYH